MPDGCTVASDSWPRRESRRGPRVWMVHPVPTIDITDAARYGGVHYVNTVGRYLYGDEVDDLSPPEWMMRDMREVVDDFRPHLDFVLIAGDHAQLMILAALLAARYPFFRILRYDRVSRSYFPIQVPGFGG